MKNPIKFSLSIFTLLFSFTTLFAEQRITTCGASEGYDFYAKSKLYEKKGWTKSKIEDGEIHLIKSNGKLDLKYKDATGVLKSVSQMGGQVITLENSEGNITVGVFAGGNAEIYSFTLDGSGKGELIWTKVRFSVIRNGGVSTAKCR